MTFSSGWWFGTFFIFPHIGLLIIPIDALIFFRGVAQPPTSLVVVAVGDMPMGLFLLF